MSQVGSGTQPVHLSTAPKGPSPPAAFPAPSTVADLSFSLCSTRRRRSMAAVRSRDRCAASAGKGTKTGIGHHWGRLR